MVSSAGGRKGYVCKGRHNVYKALRRQGKSKALAAAIANAGCTKHTDGTRLEPGRKRMAKKAARTRKARGRKR